MVQCDRDSSTLPSWRMPVGTGAVTAASRQRDVETLRFKLGETDRQPMLNPGIRQMMRLNVAVASVLLGFLVCDSHGQIFADDGAPAPVRFNRDIRPILADHCFACHGPDARSRQADLRLDVATDKTTTAEDQPIVVAGEPVSSELWKRVASADPALVMPPPDAKKPLTPTQIDALRRWIEQGAVREDHWAFVTPKRPALPRLMDPAAPGEIDGFVRAELRERNLRPAPKAPPETLIRRVTLDLTGLPPTPEEIDTFLADSSPDRYERLVDRLLASPRYGETMAVTWLDAARYADTSGYQSDGPREMWRWRDWVIEAYNANMPFDQFTIEQLAGDLLPDPTISQRLATGFHRNHRGNSEGGIVPEEYAVEYVADRVDTTGTVWLGLTIGCARCHDHKFDPISQREYYQFFAFFNTIPEFGRALKEGNSPPYLRTPTDAQQRRLDELEKRVASFQERWTELMPQIQSAQRTWEQEVAGKVNFSWTIDTGLEVVALSNSDEVFKGVNAAQETVSLKSIDAPTGRGAQFDGECFVDRGDVAKFGYFDKFTLAAWVRPTENASGGIVSRMSDDSDSDGWALHLKDGKVQVNLVKRWLDDALRVETERPLAADRWQHVAMTYDGSRMASGVRIYVDGLVQPQTIHLDLLNQTMANTEPLRIGSTGTQQRLTGAISDVRIYRRVLAATELTALSVPESVSELAALDRSKRSSSQNEKLQQAFFATGLPKEAHEVLTDLRQVESERANYVERLPTTMVMEESGRPAVAAVLERGEYNRPGERVTAGFPAALTKEIGPAGSNRLDLARWITSPEHPLTARVAVNREWQRFFGLGLVTTSEDFGTQAAPPSHPDLLDWLAAEFVESGWNVKSLQRRVVESATYRQSSRVGEELARIDPENRWLARGPRFRMPAEMLRDQALAIAGLLNERPGGPSFYPYLPDGLWSEIASTTQYQRSAATEIFRRSLYGYWKRTVSNPTMAVFDAPAREVCSVRRGRTNTPLQALTLLNDVTYVEAARGLAVLVSRDADAGPEERVREMFRRATGRYPSEAELQILRNGLDWHLARFREQPEAARQLLAIGDSATESAMDSAELAAYAAVASTILNLDECVTRE